MIDDSITNRELEKAVLDRIRQNPEFKQKLIDEIFRVENEGFPLSLLNINTLSNLEVIVKYLRENKELSYREIATKLNRQSNTLAVVYKNAKRKNPDKLKNIDYTNLVPFSIFDDENLSVLESIIVYLQSTGKKQSQIARLINRDARTVWTIANRIKQKVKHEK